MVHRNKKFDAEPVLLVDPKWNDLKAKLLTEKHNHEVKSSCYRDTTIEALHTIYAGKCAICERKRGLELQVDHYRPKKTRNNKSEREYNQPGYYWLAYSWSNLIPLCSKCNNAKRNKFPLKGWTEISRVDSHTNTKGLDPFEPYNLIWLQQQEQPLLINPEVETEPERHFKFLKNGSIVGRTEEGKETIKICNLNRTDLRRERIEIREKYASKINAAIDDYISNRNQAELKGALKSIFKEIRENTHKNKAHSLYHIYIYHYFDLFIAPYLPNSLRARISHYFQEFKGPQ